MEYFEKHTLPTILCCLCGVPIPANPSNMCVNCIRGQVDITEGIPKQVVIYWCRGCGRYLNPPNHWLICAPESRELLTFCIKKIKGLSKVKLVDAGFVWTEPHSRRLKVKLTVQKEVFTSTILQQVFIVEFVVTSQQCDKCQRVMAKDTWNAVIQARQKVEHKKTFLYMEQVILKHNAHHATLNIKEQPDGLDFFFGHRSHALKLLDFLQAIAPVRFRTSEQLVSHDEHSNTYNYKYTFSAEVAPVCRDDLVCLPSRFANSLGLANPLVLVSKMTNNIHLLDPLTLTTAELNVTQYWQAPFRALISQQHLIQYTILDVIPLGPTRGRWILADVQLARNSDLGANDTQFTARTHLGHLLQAGDTALGYDLSTGNFNDADVVGMQGKTLPDVILVRKYFPRNRKRARRNWKLRRLEMEDGEVTSRRGEVTKAERDYEQFLQDLEEDPELRANIQLYKAEQTQSDTMSMNDEDEDYDPTFPGVTVDELLDEIEVMKIDDTE
jgi:nonsense-mediated mRNA decay protein 3